MNTAHTLGIRAIQALLLFVINTSLICVAQSPSGQWTEIGTEVVDSRVGQIALDSTGALYAILTKEDKSKTIKKYANYAWEPCNQGLTQAADYIYNDRFGNVYARNRDNLYKLSTGGWQTIYTRGNNNIANIHNDGKLYAKNTTYDQKTKLPVESKIERWENGAFQPLGKNAKPLLLPNTECKFTVDNNGVIYAWEDHYVLDPQGPVKVFRYEDEKWKTITTLPCDINDEGFDNLNNWIVSGSDKDCKYFKKWDGSTWSDMPLPDGVEKEGSFGNFSPLFDEKRNIYTIGYENSAHRHTLFRFNGQKWNPVAKGTKDADLRFFIPVSNTAYGVDDYNKKFYRYDLPVAIDPNEVIDYSKVYEPQPDQDVVWFRDKFENWGLKNKKGEILIQPKYYPVSFYEGVAFVYKGKAGLIDRTGKELTPFKYSEPKKFSEGLAAVDVCDENGKNCKYSYIDKTGKTIIELPEKYKSAGSFYDGLALVSVETDDGLRYGYIDKTGKEVIPPTFFDAGDFRYNRAPVRSSDYKVGYINNTGKLVVPYKYYKTGDMNNYCFYEGLAAVPVKDPKSTTYNTILNYGYIDVNGKEIVPMKYNRADNFKNGVALVAVNTERRTGQHIYTKKGLIDKTGKELTPLKYDDIGEFIDGLALVSVLKPDANFVDKAGYIDQTGKEVIPMTYKTAKPFQDGLAYVEHSCSDVYPYPCKKSFIDKTGKIVLTTEYTVDDVSFFTDGLIMVHQCQGEYPDEKCKYGFMDKTGKLVIPLKYDFAESFQGGLAEVELNGEHFKIDTKGVEHKGGKNWRDDAY